MSGSPARRRPRVTRTLTPNLVHNRPKIGDSRLKATSKANIRPTLVELYPNMWCKCSGSVDSRDVKTIAWIMFVIKH